jgi:hypothetical protein
MMTIEHTEARIVGNDIRRKINNLRAATSAKQSLIELSNGDSSVYVTFKQFEELCLYVDASRSSKVDIANEGTVCINAARTFSISDPHAPGAFSIYPFARLMRHYKKVRPITEPQTVFFRGMSHVPDFSCVDVCHAMNKHKINEFLKRYGAKHRLMMAGGGNQVHFASALEFDVAFHNVMPKVLKGVNGMMHRGVIEHKTPKEVNRLFALPGLCTIGKHSCQVFVQSAGAMSVSSEFERDMRLSIEGAAAVQLAGKKVPQRMVSLWLPRIEPFMLETDSNWMRSLGVDHQDLRTSIYTSHSLYKIKTHYTVSNEVSGERKLSMKTPFYLIVRDVNQRLPITTFYITNEVTSAQVKSF